MTEQLEQLTESTDAPSETVRLARHLLRTRGMFSLVFVRWNHPGGERPVVDSLRSACGELRILEVDVAEVEQQLLMPALQKAAEHSSHPEAIFIFGLERAFPDFLTVKADDHPPILVTLNMQRDFLSAHMKCAVVFWLPEHVLGLIARGAPDFWSWRSGIFEFDLPTPERRGMVEFIQSRMDEPHPIPAAEIPETIIRLLRLWNDLSSPVDGISKREWWTAADIAVQLVELYLRTGQFTESENWRDEAIQMLQRIQSDSKTLRFDAARAAGKEGLLCMDRKSGNRAENIQSAIDQFRNVLTVYTKRQFPTAWATTQNNLGIAYQNLSKGDEAENLRQAIACYSATLRVCTETAFPADWAMAQNNLGTAYAGKPTGYRAENLRRAISCYTAALRIYSETDFPTAWALTQNNLGIAYAEFPIGNRGDNLRQAMDCYNAALRVRTESDFPADWATTQNNLGNIYLNLPTGDRSENLRQAISCHTAALRVRSETDDPFDWALSQFNAGLAHCDLARITADLEERKNSIDCFESAARGYNGVGMVADADEARTIASQLRKEWGL